MVHCISMSVRNRKMVGIWWRAMINRSAAEDKVTIVGVDLSHCYASIREPKLGAYLIDDMQQQWGPCTISAPIF